MDSIDTITLIGTGNMGAPMAGHLAHAGHRLVLYDLRPDVAAATAARIGAGCAASLAESGEGADLVITMLPEATAVRAALLGEGGIAHALKPGTIVVDMSSSYPPATRETGAMLEAMGLVLLDAPVSGGVKRAVDGTLAIMLGGDDAAAADRVAPVLAAMGTVTRTGALGSGHALKCLNNFLSASGLANAAEAVIVGRAFGLDPKVMIDVINTSTGRNNSTETKFHQQIFSGAFASGFALSLMAKDLAAAADLAAELGLEAPALALARDLWADARARLGDGADHTEIFRYLEARTREGT